jgi:hypothetical protein
MRNHLPPNVSPDRHRDLRELTRSRTIRKTGKHTRETVYAITSLTVADAGPEQIAAW